MGLFAETGPEPDFELIYSRYADALYRLAYSLLLSKEEAEDAVQEVFIKYLHKRPRFHHKEHEKAWLLRVTVNQCHDAARRRRVRTHSPLEEAEDFCAQTGASEIMEHVLLLDEKYKTAVLLHYFEGYSVGEVSDILRISPSAVKMRLARAREKLKSDYAEADFKEE